MCTWFDSRETQKELWKTKKQSNSAILYNYAYAIREISFLEISWNFVDWHKRWVKNINWYLIVHVKMRLWVEIADQTLLKLSATF